MEQRGLWTVEERAEFGPVPFAQHLDDYIEQFHSTSGLRREGMPAEDIEAFTTAVRGLVEPHCTAGMLELQVRSTAIFGVPHPAASG